jgi:hypothetical protein
VELQVEVVLYFGHAFRAEVKRANEKFLQEAVMPSVIKTEFDADFLRLSNSTTQAN